MGEFSMEEAVGGESKSGGRLSDDGIKVDIGLDLEGLGVEGRKPEDGSRTLAIGDWEGVNIGLLMDGDVGGGFEN